jgi:hypothetical protein
MPVAMDAPGPYLAALLEDAVAKAREDGEALEAFPAG